MGGGDIDNPAAISRTEIDNWVSEGIVNYLGYCDDVYSQIRNSHCVVLPSYREGVPRTLLEAAAVGRPIVTTDTAGCRETVDHGINGYLCRKKDSGDLVSKMRAMLGHSEEKRLAMGQAGREKMEREFDEKIVINKYLRVISELT